MEVFPTIKQGEEEGSREGSRDLDPQSLFGIRKQYSYVQLVKPSVGEDPANLDEDDAMDASGLADIEASQNGAVCIGKRAKEIDSLSGIWAVTMVFDSTAPSSDQGSVLPDGIEVDWDAESIEKVITRDPVTGEPIVNSAGEPLLMTAPISIAILTVEKVKDTFSPQEILDYVNHTNLTDFYNAPPPCALLASITARRVVLEGQWKWKVRYVTKFDLSVDYEQGERYGWAVRLLDHGTKFISAFDITGNEPPIYEIFRDTSKNPITGNLNGDGFALPDGEPLIWLPFHRYPRAELNTLQLGPF